MTDTETLDRARTALRDHAWTEAYERFSSVDRERLSGEDLERLGEAAWWSAHPSESIDAFEAAYAAYAAEGNKARAAFVAIRLSLERADRLETALSNGWLQRAIRLLADETDRVEHGYLELALVRTCMERGALDDAMHHANAAQEIGVRFSDRDLEAFALVLRGGILVFQRRAEEGLPLVDEGTLAAVAGELTPFVAGTIYCITLGVCRSVADYGRASEWTEAATQWCERQAITGFPGVCRVQRAEIMRLRGAFSEAETEARAALTELVAFGRLPQAGSGSYEIGEVRLRMGDLDGAETAFAEAHRLGHDPQPGFALCRLARNQIDAARSTIGTALADVADPSERARLLPARVEIALAAHDIGDAREAAEELRDIASTFDSPLLDAAAHQAVGVVLMQEEDVAGAIAELRSAVRSWADAGAPFETAQARRHLASAYRLRSDEASALLELRAAKDVFERLGARLEVARCDELISAADRRDAGRRVTRTFLFTDIVGSTDLIEAIGDDAWEDVLRWHDETIRTLIETHSGEVVHPTGDGFFAAFREADAAASCAIAIQRRLAEHRHRHGFAPQVRIGLHAADATVLGDDYAGLGVHEAARVAALAAGGEILATAETVADAGPAFSSSSERTVSLKGLTEPVRVATIEWQALGPK